MLELSASRNGLTISEMMDRLKVSRRTVERLLAALRRQLPIEETRDWNEREKRWRLERTSPALTAVSENELAALQTAAGRLASDGLESQAEALTTLYTKLRADLAPAQARRLEPDLEALAEAEGFALRPGPRQRIDQDLFESLRHAIKARSKVRIDYRYRGSGLTGFDVVHPYGFLYGNRHYLLAYSENERVRDIRLFVLSNLESVELLDQSFVPQEGFDLRAYAQRAFGVFQETPIKVVWRFSSAVAGDARDYVFHPTQRLAEEPDGCLLVEFTAGGLREMCWHLFTWGGEVEVVEPEELRAMMTELVEASSKT